MAARYWVGGDGNWDSTSKWSTTSGGTAGAAVPTAADDVYFDNNSGTTGMTIYLSQFSAITAVANSITVTGGLSFNVRLNSSSTLTVTAGFTVNCSAGGGIDFGSSAGTVTIGGDITHNGGSLGNAFFTASRYIAPSNTVARHFGGTLTLTSTSSSAHWSVVVGSGGQTYSTYYGADFTGAIASGATRTITHSSVAGSERASFYIYGGQSGSTTTVTAGSVVGDLVFQPAGGTWATTAISIGGELFVGTVATTGTATLTFVGGWTAALSSSGSAGIANPIVINAPADTVTVSNNFTTSATVTLTAGTLSLGSRILTCGTFASSNSNTRTIAFGTGRVDLSSTTATATLLTLTTATNLTITGTPKIGVIGAGTQARVLSNGYSVSEATAWDYIVNTTGGSTALPTFSRNVTLTTGTIAGTLNVYGSLAYTAGTLPTINFLATSGTWNLSYTSLPASIVFNGTATWSLSSNTSVTNTNSVTLTAGTLNLNNKILTTGTFSSSNSNVRTIDFGTSGRIDLSSTTATTTLLTLTTTTNLTLTGTRTLGITGAGTQTRAPVIATAVSESTAWDIVVTATGGGLTLPTYTRTLTLNGSAGFNITNATVNLYGGLVYTNGLFNNSLVNFIATSGTWPLSFTNLSSSLVFNGVGGTWQLSANCSLDTASSTTLTNGTLNLNNFVLETGIFNSSNSNVRTIAFGTSGRIDGSGDSGTLINIATATNLTTSGTPLVGVVGSTANVNNRTITIGSAISEVTAWDIRVAINGTGQAIIPTYVRTLYCVSGAINNTGKSIYGGLFYSAGSFTDTVKMAATSGTWPISLASAIGRAIDFDGVGGTWQLSADCYARDASGTNDGVILTNGTLDLNNFKLITDKFRSDSGTSRTIAFGTSGRIDLTGSGGNSRDLLLSSTNLTTTGNPTLGIVGGGLFNDTVSNGASIGESTAWNVVLDASSSYQYTIPTNIKTLTLVSGQITNASLNIYGGFVDTSSSIDFTSSSSSATLNMLATSGIWPLSFGSNATMVFNGIGGTWQLTADCTLTGDTTFTNGTLDLNNFILSTKTFSSSNSNVRTIAFGTTGRINLNSQVSATLFNITDPTNLVLTGNPAMGTSGVGAFTRVIVNGAATSEATAWDFVVNTSDGTTTIPTYTRTLYQVAGTVDNTTLNLYGGYVWTAGSVISTNVNFIATSGTWPLSFTNLTEKLVFNGNGGTWQLTGTSSLAASQSVTISQGTLSLNGFVLTLPTIIMDGGAIAFGTSNIVVNGTSGTPVNITGGSATGTPIINVTYAGIAGGSRSLTCTAPIQINVTVGADAITLLNQVHSVVFTGTFTGSLANAAVNITGNLTFKTGMTLTAGTNAVSFTGSSGTQVITPAALTFDFPVIVNTTGSTVQLAAALTMGATRALTLTAGTLNLNNFALSTGTFSSSNANTRTIAFGTTGSITLSAATATTIWNTSTATNFTTTGTTSVTAANAAGAKIINNGSVAEASAINWSILTPASVTLSGAVKNLTLNNASLVLDAVDLTVYGNFTTTALSSFATDVTPITFAATSGTQTFTTNAKTVNQPIVVNSNSTVTLGGALTSSSALSLLDGIFNAATYSVTVDKFDSSNTTTRTLQMGSGTWTLTGVGTVWDTSTTTNLTFTKGTAALALSNTTTSARTFAGGGLSYNGISIGGTTGISTTTFTGSNTFTTFASTKTVAHTIEFEPSTTTTITTWSITGTSGNVVTLGVSGGSGTFNLTSSTATAFQINFMSISNCNASPSSTTWYASRSTDGGGNFGINFFARPLYWIAGSGTWDGSTVGKWSFTSGGASAGIVPASDCDVTFDANSDSAAIFTVTVATGATCRNMTVSSLQYTMTFAGTGQLTIYGSMTLPSTLFTRTYTGAITFSATDARTITLNGQTLASAITFNGTGSWTLGSAFTTTGLTTLTAGTLGLSTHTLTTSQFATSNSNIRTLNFGTGKIVLTAATAVTIWDASTLTNLTVAGTPLVEVTSIGATTKTISIGTTANEAQSISFSILGGASSSVVLFSGNGGGVDNLTVNSLSSVTFPTTLNIYGNVTFTTSLFTFGTSLQFAGSSGTQTFSSVPTVSTDILMVGASTLQLASNITLGSTNTVTVTSGSFVTSNFNLAASSFSSNNTNTRSISLGSSSILLSGTGTIWDLGTTTGLTFNAGSSTISPTNTSATARTFVGGGLTYNTLTIGGVGGSINTLTITGSNTFNNFGSTKTISHTILFEGGTTNTFTSFTVTGTVGNVVTVGSTNTTKATISKPTVWYVGSNSTNGGNNSNLIFSGGNNLDYLNLSYINGDPPVPASSGFFMFCT